MTQPTEHWTSTHDLALVFIALAYGTDRILADAELKSIVARLNKWQPTWDVSRVQEVVMEAVAVYLAGSAHDEITAAITRLRRALDTPSRHRALEDAVKVAESDGILLGSERSLISVLAKAWGIKDLPDSQHVNADGDWGILHDVGLMYVAIAHGGDADLSEAEIQAMIARLIQWQPDLEEEGARKVLREALRYYSTQPDSDDFSVSVDAIKDTFPIPQRVAVLDDLVFIAESDGTISVHEQQMIKSLSDVWGVGVKL